ncbi:hypothetical protein SAMN05216370_2729 [Pseudomonas peli]|jgi:uncharacterized protein YijF (DUF1287 family)|uniref:DUF1287 domain-containing protein n=1 Tax=Pseudomonas peli TaxID=592361 RepID=A0AB37Z941_9PSED|nr:DUF1287 domain-containing protein [Pseudomonas peli]NMZ70313.1 DUF1287 domain-containing protein [Pseudomonas peli]OHC27035.1 MAG: DUF1287 domain-containing protein [Pseudomonadales bacterium RIFCSPHIGHO2_02_FULL_60_43]SCW67760.1 hypothetical protein SAMN05216370_2729 [Pseudomonas peli]|tara:strand:- start:11434 stop:12009 length:576 start_codon:yes stop_codon:yes gene_type:complete
MRAILLFALAMLLSAQAWALQADVLVTAAREQVGVTLSYDPAYRRLSYPNGDVPLNTGVCTDVVIRALREQGLDLQQAVHQDMRANFRLYPKNWALSRPDSNIDHRRVPNLMTWFKRQGWALPLGQDAERYRPGDIVTWDLGGGLTHIGIISDRQAGSGVPLVLHNIGRGTQEEDILFSFKITGHYRIPAA